MQDPAAEPLYRLMYVSTSSRFLSDTQIDDLLQEARAGNGAARITGMLIYLDGHFLQYIEGDRAAVETLIHRIERDPRHHGIIRLMEGTCDKRAFGDWSMGYRRLGKGDGAPLAGAVDLARRSMRDSLPANLPRELLVLMESFYDTSGGR